MILFKKTLFVAVLFLAVWYGLFSLNSTNNKDKLNDFAISSWTTINSPLGMGADFTFDLPSSWPNIVPVSPGGYVKYLIPDPTYSYNKLSNTPDEETEKKRGKTDTFFTVRIPEYSDTGRDSFFGSLPTPIFPLPIIFAPFSLQGKTLETYFFDEKLKLKSEKCETYNVAGRTGYICHFNTAADLDPNDPNCPEYNLMTHSAFVCYLQSYPADLIIFETTNGKALLIIDPVRKNFSTQIIQSVKIVEQ